MNIQCKYFNYSLVYNTNLQKAIGQFMCLISYLVLFKSFFVVIQSTVIIASPECIVCQACSYTFERVGEDWQKWDTKLSILPFKMLKLPLN